MSSTNTDKPKKLSAVEEFKARSRGLRGPIASELGQAEPFFSEEAVQLLKHHGAYQQDDRDTRTERKKAGLDKDYSFMLRTKFPGGHLTAEQYLLCDDMANKYGQNDIRVTSRQCFQFHGVVKKHLRPLIHDLNRYAQITSLGACGDVVRNVMACPVADIDPRFAEAETSLTALARSISDHFLPTTKGYFDLWIDDEKVTVNDDGTVNYANEEVTQAEDDPIYRANYLPRKFKIAIALDFDNSADAYTNDIAIIAITDNGRVTGYEIAAGGGLGFTHRKEATYSRLATPLALVNQEDALGIVEAIVKVQRDYGDRTNRRHARMKYLIDDIGIQAFRAKVFEYAGREFAPPMNVTPKEQPSYLGWTQQRQPGLNYVGLWIENGRIRDFPASFQFKTGLRDLIERFEPHVRLTPHHNVILANIRDEDVEAVQQMLDQYQIPTDNGVSPLRRMEMACPALPTCGLALAEAERFLPEVAKSLEQDGHGDADIVLRISGCPNNCSRPRSAELGVIGCGSGLYHVYTGGGYFGERLCELLLEKVPAADLAGILSRLLTAWKQHRNERERFGDWSARVGVEKLRKLAQPAANT